MRGRVRLMCLLVLEDTRDRGTPQGAVVSPVLANLFLHYAFDCWMKREYPDIPFPEAAELGPLSLRQAGRAARRRVRLCRNLSGSNRNRGRSSLPAPRRAVPCPNRPMPPNGSRASGTLSPVYP